MAANATFALNAGSAHQRIAALGLGGLEFEDPAVSACAA
jgi:hypothetical protein